MNFKNLPQVRSGLNVTELGSELIVFDSATSNAHCLDKIGGAVFLACRDGASVESLEQKLGSEYSEEVVQVALAQLEELSLLEESSGGVDRRKFLTVVGAGVAGVVVASVAAPSPVAAQSCVRCRVDVNTKLPCDCSTCGLPCSFAVSDDQPCSPPPTRPKGVCGSASSVCCFEYIKSGAVAPPGEPVCFAENLGDYGCRPVKRANPATNQFSEKCLDARGLPAVVDGELYYCCCCSVTGSSRRNCFAFC